MTARKYAPICSFPGCGRKHNAKGLCNPHGAMARRGEPLRPILDRTGPVARSAIDRFATRVALQDDGCLVWLGGKTVGGYGIFAPLTEHRDGSKAMAHRWLYEHHGGSIPEGYDIDHLCRNRACVNPEHLEPVTRAENIRRAAAIKTHCVNGHPFDEANTLIPPGTNHRRCKACIRARDIARAPKRSAQRRAQNRLKREGRAA